MNQLKKETNLLEKELKTLLKGSHAGEVIGKNFTFSAEFGTHFEVLMGTIVGAGYSDEGGLKLYVSCPKFSGLKLNSIVWESKKGKTRFFARVHNNKTAYNDLEGNFKMHY